MSPPHKVGLQLRGGSELRKPSFPLDQDTLHTDRRWDAGALPGPFLELLPAVAASSCKLGWRPAGQTNTGAAGLTSVPP